MWQTMKSGLAAVVVLMIGASAGADPMGAVAVDPAPEDRGDIFSPGIRLVADLEQDYVEEEFLVSGQATIYTYNDPPVRGEIIPLESDVPYTTRIIVRRPAQQGRFKGTVVIEWWNSTAGFDTAPVWDASAEFFARRGWVYIGLTNSTSALDFLAGGCSLFGILPPTCDMRYAELFMPGNGQAFEMASQLATLLKSDEADQLLPQGFDVERIFHAGQSQQGGSMVTYASAFHFPPNDGYFIQAASSARPINFETSCNDENAAPYPDCTPRLEDEQRLVRRDLPVPVVRAMTETDMDGVLAFDTRQDDSEAFRYYEMPGTAHTTVHKDVEVLPAGIFGPDPLFLEQFCALPLNSLADGPVFGS